MSVQEHSPNDPNRGLNTKVFMLAILVAFILISLGLYFFVAVRGSKSIPKANRNNPNAHLVVPQMALVDRLT